MSDITAAIGVAQMRKIDTIIAKRIELAKWYDRNISVFMPFLEPAFRAKGNYHIYQSYVALVKPEYAKLRDWIIEMFSDCDIQTNIGTYALHRQPFFRTLDGDDSLPVSSDIFDRAIALPMYYNIDFEKMKIGGLRIWQEILNMPGSLSSRKKIPLLRGAYGFHKGSGGKGAKKGP